MKRYLLLFIFLVLPLQSHAAFQSGNGLLREITRPPELNNGFGTGYISGVFDAYEGLTHCVTASGVTQGQVERIARRYLEAHPELLHRPAFQLLLKAFTESFPCPTR